MATILVVDDEHGIRELLSEILNDEGHQVETAENAAQARTWRQSNRPDLVLLDIWMPDTDGVSLLKEWASGGMLGMPVIMMSGHATIDTAVEATKIGAHSFLEKPITLQKLLKAVSTALQPPVTASPAPRDHSHAPVYAQPAGYHPHVLVGNAAVSNSTLAMRQPMPVQNPVAHPSQQLFALDRPLREARDDFERAYFEFHLIQEHGSMTRVAEKTGLERTHLYRKLKQLGIDFSRGKRSAEHRADPAM